MRTTRFQVLPMLAVALMGWSCGAGEKEPASERRSQSPAANAASSKQEQELRTVFEKHRANWERCLKLHADSGVAYEGMNAILEDSTKPMKEREKLFRQEKARTEALMESYRRCEEERHANMDAEVKAIGASDSTVNSAWKEWVGAASPSPR